MQCMGIVPNVVRADRRASVDQTATTNAKKDVRILPAMPCLNQRRRKMSNESAACNCMGPQNGEPFCPCMMNRLGIFKRDGKWVEPEKVVGVVNDPNASQPMPFSQKWTSPCSDFRHNPPMGLYVAPGETYVHVCPACGFAKSITGSNITFSEVDLAGPRLQHATEGLAYWSLSDEEDEDAFAAESDDEILDKLGR